MSYVQAYKTYRQRKKNWNRVGEHKIDKLRYFFLSHLCHLLFCLRLIECLSSPFIVDIRMLIIGVMTNFQTALITSCVL